jgi:hypothetical protein
MFQIPSSAVHKLQDQLLLSHECGSWKLESECLYFGINKIHICICVITQHSNSFKHILTALH